jgi:hypothetical protein
MQLEAGDKKGHIFKSSQVIQASNYNVCMYHHLILCFFSNQWLQSIHQNICGIMVVFFWFTVPIYEHSSAHGLLLSLP